MTWLTKKGSTRWEDLGRKMRSSVLGILEITMVMVMNESLKSRVESVAEIVPNAGGLIYLFLTDLILPEWQVDAYPNSWPEGVFCIVTAAWKVLFLSSFQAVAVSLTNGS